MLMIWSDWALNQPQPPEEALDVLIIGAGAAGIAAARRLHDTGRRVLILEARKRIGGRMWSDHAWAGFPLELGAEFIHGERAVTHDLVRTAGLTTAPVPRYRQLRWSEGGAAQPVMDLPPALRQTIGLLFDQYQALPSNFQGDEDCSLAEYLRRQSHDDQALAIADVLLAQTCCASSETLSCADLAREMRVDHAGREEFYLAEGYAALLGWLSRGLAIRLNTPVNAIRWSGDGVIVQSGDACFFARHCLVTIPVSLLQRGAIRFEPPLSQEKEVAIHAFRTEPATKLIFRFRQPLWDDDLVYMAHTGVMARWWTPAYGCNQPVLTAFVTAGRARQVDAMPEAEALALGLQELGQMIGVADLASACIAARRVAWAHEPYTRGGYAHLPPAASAARIKLAQPEADVLFFAGEATAWESNPQTVHGAIESGWRAAAECEAALD
jgi:monoamine oxidase